MTDQQPTAPSDPKSLAVVMRHIFDTHTAIMHPTLVLLRQAAIKAYSRGGVAYTGSPAMVLLAKLDAGEEPALVLNLTPNELNRQARAYEKKAYGNARSRRQKPADQ